jgi:chorismate synthase
LIHTDGTLGRVAAGAVAEKFLKEAYGTEIVAFVSSVGKVAMPFIEEQSETGVPSEEFVELLSTVTREMIDMEATRCPDKEMSKKMTQVRISRGEKKESWKIQIKVEVSLLEIRYLIGDLLFYHL